MFPLQIPVCGVLTNALEYQLFRFDPIRNPGIIRTSEVLRVPLKARMTSDEARIAIKEVVAILVQLLVDQKKGYRDFWREHKKNASRPNSARQTSRAGSRFKVKGATPMKRQGEVKFCSLCTLYLHLHILYLTMHVFTKHHSFSDLQCTAHRFAYATDTVMWCDVKSDYVILIVLLWDFRNLSAKGKPPGLALPQHILELLISSTWMSEICHTL